MKNTNPPARSWILCFFFIFILPKWELISILLKNYRIVNPLCLKNYTIFFKKKTVILKESLKKQTALPPYKIQLLPIEHENRKARPFLPRPPKQLCSHPATKPRPPGHFSSWNWWHSQGWTSFLQQMYKYLKENKCGDTIVIWTRLP